VGVSRREVPGAHRVDDYADSPAGDVLVHLAEDSDRLRVTRAGKGYEEAARATLRALLGKGFRRVAYVSSAVLYGDADSRAHRPGDPLQINDTYTRIKRQSELAVLGAPAGTVVRPSNLYGPGMSTGTVLSAILRQIPGTGRLSVMDTTPVRDFLWVEDAAEGIAALACLEENRDGGVFNLGTGVGTMIGDVARMALKIAGQPEREVTALQAAGRRSSLILDYSDTAAACGWGPRVSLREGLTRLLEAPGG